jgi:hypothetical protein
MSSSCDECASEFDSNIVSTMSWSVRFLFVAVWLNALQYKGHIANPTLFESLIAIQTCALPALLHVIVLTEKRLNCGVEVRHKCETTIHKNHEEILTEEWWTFAIGPILHQPMQWKHVCISLVYPWLHMISFLAAPSTQIGQHLHET